MVAFNREFLPEYFFSIDQETIPEFEQAYVSVCRFSPQKENVASCFEKVRYCFSPATYIRYPKEVKDFLQKAQQELVLRVAALGSDKLGSRKRPPLSSIESEAPSPKRHKACFSYLENYLHVFICETTRGVNNQRSLESVKSYYAQKLGEFNDFCDRFKTQPIRTFEIDQVKKKAKQHIQDSIEEAALLYRNPHAKDTCLYKVRQAVLLDIFRAPGLEKEFEAFLSQNSHEDDPDVLQKKFQFFCQFYNDSKDSLDWSSFLRENFSSSCTPDWIDFFSKKMRYSDPEKIKEWASSPVVKTKLQDLQLQPLYENAETACKKLISENCYQLLLKLCKNPRQVERLLHALSDAALRALKDESLAGLILDCQDRLGFNREIFIPGLARKIEVGISAAERMKKLGVKDQDIRGVLSFFDLQFFFIERVEPHTEFMALPQEKMTKVVEVITHPRDVRDQASLVQFVLCGGEEDVYRKLEHAFPLFEINRKTIAVMETLSDEELKTAQQFTEMKFLPSFLSEEQVKEIVAVLHNKELCGIFESVKTQVATSLVSGATRLADLSCFAPRPSLDLGVRRESSISTNLVTPREQDRWQLGFKGLPPDLLRNFFGIGEAKRFSEIPLSYYLLLSPEVRYLLAKYAHPFDPISFFYSSAAVNRLEQDIANAPLSIVPPEVLIRYLETKPLSLLKDWLSQSIDTPEGPKTRLETISRELKSAILSQCTTQQRDLPVPELRQLLGVSAEILSTTVIRPEQNGSSRFLTLMATWLERNKDSLDPLYLLKPMHGLSIANAIRCIAGLLIVATQTKPFLSRTFRKWGEISKVDSSITCEFQVMPLPSSLQELFKKVNSPIPSGKICRELAHLNQSVPNWIENLDTATLASLSSQQRGVVFSCSPLWKRFIPAFHNSDLHIPKQAEELVFHPMQNRPSLIPKKKTLCLKLTQV